MLQGDNTRVFGVPELAEKDLQRIKDFFQGAVYCWCKNRKGEWFKASSFLGGDNFLWEDTPLGILHFRYRNAGKSEEDAIDQAGKDAGNILKMVLAEDKRKFETEKGDPARMYLWVE